MMNFWIDSKSIQDEVIQIKSLSMSDPPLSVIDIKNKMAWVWTTLKITTFLDYRKKMKLSSLILSICSITTDGAPGKSSKNFQKMFQVNFLPVKLINLQQLSPDLKSEIIIGCGSSADGHVMDL